jgi:GNAT superfamily N-acetyltransferase
MFFFTPVSRPEELETPMTSRGLTMIPGGPAMWVDLHDFKQVRPSPSGFKMERITNDAGMDVFRDIYFEGHEENRPYIDYIVNSMKLYGYAPDATIRCYISHYDGEPATISTLSLDGGVAGLWAVVTKPEMRRKGLGTAMSLSTLREAIPLGYRFGVLFSTDMGMKIYERIGFQECFKLTGYIRSEAH